MEFEDLVGVNHPHLVATLCSSFSRENGHPNISFAHDDTHPEKTVGFLEKSGVMSDDTNPKQCNISNKSLKITIDLHTFDPHKMGGIFLIPERDELMNSTKGGHGIQV